MVSSLYRLYILIKQLSKKPSNMVYKHISLVGIFFVPVLILRFHKPWVSNFLPTSQHNVTCKCFRASIHKKRAKRRSFHMSESCHEILKSSLLFPGLFSRLLFCVDGHHSFSLESDYQLCCCVPKYVFFSSSTYILL